MARLGSGKKPYIVIIKGDDQASDVIEKVQIGLRKMEGSTKRTAQRVGRDWKTMGRNIAIAGGSMVAVIYAAQRAMDALKSVKAGAQILDLRDAFERLGGSAQIMAELRDAVQYGLDEQTLLRFHNMASALGITSDEFVDLAEIAKAASKTMGLDLAYAIESISTGVARQSAQWLDNLGIQIKAKEAQERYAEAINKTAKELTDAQKRQAFINEAIRKGQELITAAGGGESAVDSFDRLTASISDLKTALATGAAESGFDRLALGLSKFINQVTRAIQTPIPDDYMFALTSSYMKAGLLSDVTVPFNLEDELKKKGIHPGQAESSAAGSIARVTQQQLDAAKRSAGLIKSYGLEQDEEGNLISGEYEGYATSQRQQRIQAAMEEAQQLTEIESDGQEISLASWTYFEEQKTKASKEQAALRVEAARLGLQALATAFPKMKGLAVAEAIVSTYQGITNALATGGPYPLNILAASVVAAQGFAAVKSIQSQGISTGAGGTSSYSYGGATPTVPASGSQGKTPVNVTIRLPAGDRHLYSINDMVEILKVALPQAIHETGGQFENVTLLYNRDL